MPTFSAGGRVFLVALMVPGLQFCNSPRSSQSPEIGSPSWDCVASSAAKLSAVSKILSSENCRITELQDWHQGARIVSVSFLLGSSDKRTKMAGRSMNGSQNTAISLDWDRTSTMLLNAHL